MLGFGIGELAFVIGHREGLRGLPFGGLGDGGAEGDLDRVLAAPGGAGEVGAVGAEGVVGAEHQACR